jgi:hypothetical protein
MTWVVIVAGAYNGQRIHRPHHARRHLTWSASRDPAGCQNSLQGAKINPICRQNGVLTTHTGDAEKRKVDRPDNVTVAG